MWTIKGLLTEDRTLTADHVYYVSSSLGVDEGVTLTIEPGTRLEFAENAGLYGFGKIVAHGTPEKPITFVGHEGEGPWRGVFSHAPTGKHEHDKYKGLFTNKDSTLFTLLPTDITPYNINTLSGYVYYDPSGNAPKPTMRFELTDYVEKWDPDFTRREQLLTDPNYLTPAVLEMMKDWKKYYEQCTEHYPTNYNSSFEQCGIYAFFVDWYAYDNPTDLISYCKLDGLAKFDDLNTKEPIFEDCVINPIYTGKPGQSGYYVSGVRNVLDNLNWWAISWDKQLRLSNIINIFDAPISYEQLASNNCFNNYDLRGERPISFAVFSDVIQTVKAENPSYLGTNREDLLRPYFYEMGNYSGTVFGFRTYATIDLSNMLKEPIKEAHGIVWKILVNGKDAQDEQEYLPALGVGKHKFEIYFNRPMNKNVIPQISFGVISPYNQIPVSENGGWNNNGTIYTAYVTIDGKTQSDGMNRIYVRDAEDNEYFPCPYEATRFNIMVQAAGSMASGFQADAGCGCVKLKWNNENNDFEDAMGFNVYRYTQGENNVNDTIRLNTDIIDISATSYVDDQVKPGTTYYYYYKVLSTALQEYDISNVVATTPLTATRGDANGNGSVDVTDVITTVNYVIGQQPKPFVFDAADMNSDKLIDILDVVGIIQGILNPSLLSVASVNEKSAIYYMENGTLYVESPVDLSGIQIQLALPTDSEVEISDNLDGFEHASCWLSENDYLFMAYSLSGKKLAAGKHALLYVGDGQVASIKLGDANGRNITAINNGTTGIDRMGKDVMHVKGIYDLQGRKLSTLNSQPLKKGIYIIDGQKVVK